MSCTSSLKRSEEVVVPSWPLALTKTALDLALDPRSTTVLYAATTGGLFRVPRQP
jgi:hypothetical protein